MNLSIELPEAQAARLRAMAERLGVEPGRLARAAVADLVTRRDDEFSRVVKRVLAKNAELYRRLR